MKRAHKKYLANRDYRLITNNNILIYHQFQNKKRNYTKR